MVELTSQDGIKIEISNSINQTANSSNASSDSMNASTLINKTEFEQVIVASYHSLQNKNSNYKTCKENLMRALHLIQETKNDKTIQIIINKNILDKLKRITHHKILQINILIGKLYIHLFHFDNLFVPSKDENLVIMFINESINLWEQLRTSSISLKFERNVVTFLKKIRDSTFNFNDEQKECLTALLQDHFTKETQKPNLQFDSFPKFLSSLNKALMNQQNLYDQYLLFLDNKNQILELIRTLDQNNTGLYEDYFTFGKIASMMLFNKKFHIYMSKSEESDESIAPRLFYDDSEIESLEFVNRELYNIEIDEDITQYREDLIQIIIEFIGKIYQLQKIFEFQYISYLLLRRIYMNFLYDLNLTEKKQLLKKRVDEILSAVLINLCTFQKEQCEDSRQLLQYFRKSKNEQDSNIKQLIEEQINEKKADPLYDFESTFEVFSSLFIEGLSFLDFDLKLGFFNMVTIPAGESFSFFIELEQKCSLLDFGFTLTENDINFIITDVTEKEPREVIKMSQVTVYEAPIKFTFYNNKPCIYKIEFDNSYSWFNSKEVKFKSNIFYPERELDIIDKLNTLKLKHEILNEPNIGTLNNHSNKILLLKLSGKNKVFNCGNVLNNITKFESLKKKKVVELNAIYVDKNKNKFYGQDFTMYDLSLENFKNYLDTKFPKVNEEISIVSENEENLHHFQIINLYDISCNQIGSNQESVTFDNILGFQLNTLTNENIIFYPSILSQSGLLYELYQRVLEGKKIEVVYYINYFKESGMQVSFYREGQLINNTEELMKINFNESIENNCKIINDLINFDKDIAVECIISSNDEEVASKIKEQFEKEKNPSHIITTLNQDYLNNLYITSPVFYLDE